MPAALTPKLLLYIAARMLSAVAAQIQAVALGWFIYSQTGSALSVGLIGLAQFAPGIPMLAVSGYAADHYDRSKVVVAAQLIQIVGIAGLCLSVLLLPDIVWLIYLWVTVIAASRAMSQPSLQAMLPSIVAREEFPRAIAMSSSANQSANIVGPAIGGLLYAVVGQYVFLTLLAFPLVTIALIIAVKAPKHVIEPNIDGSTPLQRAWAGLTYVRHNRLLRGLMLLDLLAVLLGGINALLPIFAHDILHVGAEGLGVLTAGPAIGAVLVGALLSYMPLNHRAGIVMLAAIAGFGVGNIVFGFSTSFVLSLVALICSGGFDMVSMVVRHTILQTATPDSMRGRVSAVNSLFTGASSQLGNFESGIVASLIGAMPAAVVGGVGTLLVVAGAAALFPEIRRTDSIHTVTPPPEKRRDKRDDDAGPSARPAPGIVVN